MRLTPKDGRDYLLAVAEANPGARYVSSPSEVLERRPFFCRRGMGHSGARPIGDVPGVTEEVRDLGELVLFLGRLQATGRSGGVPVDAPYGVVSDFRDGRISRMRAFLDHGEALQAAGLTE